LREFYLVGNDVEVLKANTFEHNQRLELIWLDGNKIKRISSDIFDHLDKLRYLNVREKSCTLPKVSYDHERVWKVIAMMKRKCFN
jgi:hypothetical protein